jgi:hypothetical protein
MNERIKELAEQARKYADENRPGSFVKYDPEWFVLYNEKFAELIVRECANEILKWKSEPFPYDPEFGAKLIKEHFGIKE